MSMYNQVFKQEDPKKRKELFYHSQFISWDHSQKNQMLKKKTHKINRKVILKFQNLT